MINNIIIHDHRFDIRHCAQNPQLHVEKMECVCSAGGGGAGWVNAMFHMVYDCLYVTVYP